VQEEFQSFFSGKGAEGAEWQLRSVPLSIFDCVIFGLDFPASFLNRSNGGCSLFNGWSKSWPEIYDRVLPVPRNTISSTIKTYCEYRPFIR
jgi:hypothetical protein